MATIAVLGTLDTKGVEHAFVADCIRAYGHTPLIIDVGTGAPPQVVPDVSREQVWKFADNATPSNWNDRGQAVAAMGEAAPRALLELFRTNRFQGVISLGGGGGTSIGTAAMRALPIGVPKVMVSTLAAGDTSAYLGSKDIVMIPAIVDIAGLNRISRRVLQQAAGAVCGMVDAASRPADSAASSDKPLIVASMFGNTTACVNSAKNILEAAGYEVLVFHATGAGGRAMEAIIESGSIVGVLDLTTTEWADEVVGGVLSAGPNRLGAAARTGTPAVVAPGCLDMVNFRAPETVPSAFAGRTFYHHNPQVTLLRTSAAEAVQIGKRIAERVNESIGPVTVLLPLNGLSAIGVSGQPFHDPVADAALFDALRSNLRPGIPVIERSDAINDAAFAEAAAGALLKMLAVHV
jgi:uncharacterized protein (UPF0261 family)